MITPRLFFLLLVSFGLGAYSLPWLDYWRFGAVAQARVIAPRGDLAADEQATIQLFREASPSVAYITTVSQRVNPFTLRRIEIDSGTGSGFVWDDRGHIVTNFHVIREASGARVVLFDNQVYDATLVGVSPDHDLAVLRVDAPAHRLRPIPLGTDNEIQVGQKAFAIGNPFGLDRTLTVGVVSALGRTIPSSGRADIEGVIQTDAAINPGNSGGPLLDSAGRLMGVNTAIYSPSGAYAGIGFAVPVDTVNRVVPQLIRRGRFERPKLGIRVHEPTSQPLLQELGVEGVLILDVQPNSPAARANLRGTTAMELGGIRVGDVIQKINGHAVRSQSELFHVLDRFAVGDRVELTYYRSGQTYQATVELTP